MRRLLILTAATVLMASSGCFHWFNRGSAYNAGYPAGSCGDPSVTSAGPPVSEGYVMPGPTP